MNLEEIRLECVECALWLAEYNELHPTTDDIITTAAKIMDFVANGKGGEL